MLLLGLLTVQGQTDATWYLEDFESLGVLGPEGWTVGEIGEYASPAFKAAVGQGVDASNAFQAQMSQTVAYYFYTQAVNFGPSPIVEFQYKTAGVIGNADDHCMSLDIAVSSDAQTWTSVKTVAAADFTASSTYATLKAVLPETYANGQNHYVKLSATPTAEAGTVNLYIDNFGVGTPAEQVENDLTIKEAPVGPTMPKINTETIYMATVFNNGTTAQSTYTLQLIDAAGTLLASTNGTALEAGAQTAVELKYTPTQAGEMQLRAVVTATADENRANDTSAALTIDVQAEGTVVEVVNGNALCLLQPFGFLSETNVALALYTADELSYMRGTINRMVFEGNFASEVASDIQVYVGETDEEQINPIDPTFIDPATLTKVYDGPMTFPQGDRQLISIPFNAPYTYTGRTLAIYTFCKTATGQLAAEISAHRFYGIDDMKAGNPVRAIATNGGPDTDPMKPNEAEGAPKFQRPGVKLFFSEISDEKYSLTFTVKDADGTAISNAVVTLDDETYDAGRYTFEDLPARLHTYTVSAANRIPVQGRLSLQKDTVIDITLIDMAGYPGLSGFLSEDFENIAQGKRPNNWTGDFSVETFGGREGGRRLTHSFWYLDGPREITTNPVFMGAEPAFEFYYRVMEMDDKNMTYSGNAFAGKNLSWSISVSTDFGITWKDLYNEEYGTHTADTNYNRFVLDMTAYANKICLFLIHVERDNQENDAFYFDIDDWKIGTQLEKDLAIVSKIQGMRVIGAKAETAYTVTVRNLGTEASGDYTVKFYDGETEIASVAGPALASGAFADVTVKHTFTQEGEHTLSARIVAEADMSAINDRTADFYVSVRPENVTCDMVEAYEGENTTHTTPCSFYSPYSLSEILYNRNDLNIEAGTSISGIAFRTSFSKAVERIKLTVYIVETDLEHISGKMLVPSTMNKAFEGVITAEAKDGGNLVIDFTTPHRYTGRNLAIAVYKEGGAFSYDETMAFYGYFDLGYISVASTEGEDPIDLTLNGENVSAGFVKPSTTFLLRNDIAYHSVNFEVTDQNGQPVQNATVTFNGQTLKTGVYKVEDVADGTYAYSVSLGEETVEGSVTVSGADVTEKVQFQHVANENILTETMVRIYPNPTTDKLHIDVAEGAKEINLYDISGRTVRKLNRVPAGIIEMDLSDCHSGIYLLMIDGKAFKISKR